MLSDFDYVELDDRLKRLSKASHELRSTAFDAYAIPRRLRNIFWAAGYRTVGDLVDGGTKPIVLARGFGTKMGCELARIVDTLVTRSDCVESPNSAYPETSGSEVDFGSQIATLSHEASLIEQIEAALANLRPRDAVVWKARSGYNGVIPTLEDVARQLGVTRERTRQLAKRASEAVAEAAPGCAKLGAVVSKLLAEAKGPLSLAEAAANDPLLAGLDARPFLFAQFLKEDAASSFHIWELHGILIVSAISHADWRLLQRRAAEVLSQGIPAGITHSQAQDVVVGLARSWNAAELGFVLHEAMMPKLHFAVSDNASGPPTLHAVGRGSGSVVTAIMEEATAPLTLTEVGARFYERTGKRPSRMALRNTLQGIGAHVFARRRYGLRKHVPIAPTSIDAVAQVAVELIRTRPSGHQWHCADIVRAIVDAHPELADGLDPYALNICLQGRTDVVSLGRLAWCLPGSKLAHVGERMSISGSCVLALESAGKPLRQGALARRVRAMRGLSSNFMPQPNASMARVRPGVWGLVRRDFPFPLSEHCRILNDLETALRDRDKGLHASEIARAVGIETSRPRRIGAAVFGLAQTDKRFRTGRGCLVGLASWPTLRRHNVSAAIKKAFHRLGEFKTPDQLYTAVDELAERYVSRARILAEAKRLGHDFAASSSPMTSR